MSNLVSRFSASPPAALFTGASDGWGAGGSSLKEQAAGTRVGRLLNSQTMGFTIARARREYLGAFRLVYQAYVDAGLAKPNPFGMRVTPFQLLPSTEVMVAVRGSDVVATVSLVRDGELGLPMEAVYAAEVASLRHHGGRVAEVSCLADAHQGDDRSPAVTLRLMSLMAQCAQIRGVNQLLIAVHPRHARFYQRFTAFEPLGGLTNYQAVCNRPAVALALDLDRAPIDHPDLYQRFFGAPLPADVLAYHPMPEGLREELKPVVESSYDDHVYSGGVPA